MIGPNQCRDGGLGFSLHIEVGIPAQWQASPRVLLSAPHPGVWVAELFQLIHLGRQRPLYALTRTCTYRRPVPDQVAEAWPFESRSHGYRPVITSSQ